MTKYNFVFYIEWYWELWKTMGNDDQEATKILGGIR